MGLVLLAQCVISAISKNEAINVIQNADFTKKKWNIIKQRNSLFHIKTGEEILTFGDFEIEKKKCYRNKTPIFLKDVDIEKVLVSNKISFGEKNLQILY